MSEHSEHSEHTESVWGMCDVNGCEEHFKPDAAPYGTCQSCEEFSICGKQDAAHYDALLYWEECREHDTGGYSICISCASEAYRTSADFKEGEERCICPKCDHDFGLLATVTATPANN